MTLPIILTVLSIAIPLAVFALTALGKRWREREKRKRFKVRK